LIETKHWAGRVRRGDERDTHILETNDGWSVIRTSPLKQDTAKIRFIHSLSLPSMFTVEGLGVLSHETVCVDPALRSALLERGALYRHLRVRQQHFARAGTTRLPVYEVTACRCEHAIRDQRIRSSRVLT
jgi:hypothetical protein